MPHAFRWHIWAPRPLSWDPKDVVPDSGSGTHSSHPSTNQARPCLASKIRRDRAHSGWYGRRLGTHSQGWVSLGCACRRGRLHVRQCPWGWLGVLAAAYSDCWLEGEEKPRACHRLKNPEAYVALGSWLSMPSSSFRFYCLPYPLP